MQESNQSQNYVDERTFCHAPWHSAYLSPDGDYRVCCISKESLGRPEDFNNFQEVFNGEKYKEIRKQFLNGAIPLSCKSCYLKESYDFKSVRQYFTELVEEKSDLSVYKEEAESHQLERLDLCLANICNLACEYCEPMNSSRRQKKVKEFNEVNSQFYRPLWSNKMTVSDRDYGHLETLIDYSTNIKAIDFKGGEPLMAKSHKSVLERLQPRAHEIRLNYFTNGSIYDPGVVDLWKNFKEVQIFFSIDADDDLFSYIRSGPYSLKDHVEPNLRKYASSLNNLKISVHNTLSIFNVLSLNKFFEWWNPLYEEFNCLLSLGMVNGPDFLTLNALTPELKQLAMDRITELNLSDEDHFYNKFNNIRQTIAKSEFKEKYARDLIYHCSVIEQKKKNRFVDLVPEFKDYWERFGHHQPDDSVTPCKI